MNALAPIHTLSADEAELMAEVLGVGPDGRNCVRIGRGHANWHMIRDLEARGLMTLQKWASCQLWNISVSTAGAREVVRAGAIPLADLAVDVNLWLVRLVAYRHNIAAGLADASLCSGFDLVPDEPYARVAAAILIKRGLVEQRGPEGERELSALGPDALLIRAIDGAAT